jgi:hypothetical protein
MPKYTAHLSFAVPAVCAVIAACGGAQESEPAAPPPAPPPAATAPSPPPAAEGPKTIDVMLCDGKTQVRVPEGTSGTTIAGALMGEWLRKNPNVTWAEEQREAHELQPSADNSRLIGQVDGHTYGKVTAEDVALWKTETERVALGGSRVFHDATELGSTIAVSCDMCHPHAANTHPETYPKYQRQLGRVALLRDMINWCIEHPVRGKPLASEDPRLRAMEAYILAQRRGKTMEYGKM